MYYPWAVPDEKYYCSGAVTFILINLLLSEIHKVSGGGATY